MKTVFKKFLFVCIALVAVFSFGIVEPVSATECISNVVIEHSELSAVLAGVPLLAVIKNECTISVAEINALKAKYGKIKILSVVIEPPVYTSENDNYTIEEKGEVYYFAVRRPDTSHVRMLKDYAKKGDDDGYVNCFIKNLVVGGDTEALNNDGLVYLGLMTQIEPFLKPYQSFLENA